MKYLDASWRGEADAMSGEGAEGTEITFPRHSPRAPHRGPGSDVSPRPPKEARKRQAHGRRPAASVSVESLSPPSLLRSESPFHLPPITPPVAGGEGALCAAGEVGATGFGRFQEMLEHAITVLGGNPPLDKLWQLLSQVLEEMMQKNLRCTQLKLTEQFCENVAQPPALDPQVDSPVLCSQLDCILSFCTQFSPRFRTLAETVRRQLHALIFVTPPHLSNLPDLDHEDDVDALRRVYVKHKTFKALVGHRKAADEPRLNIVVRTLRQQAQGGLRTHLLAWREVCLRKRLRAGMEMVVEQKDAEIVVLNRRLQEAQDKIASLELALKHQRMRTFTDTANLKASYEEQVAKVKERNALLTQLSDDSEARRAEIEAQYLEIIEKLKSRDIEYQTDYERAKGTFEQLLPSSSPEAAPDNNTVRTQLISIIRKGGALDEVMAGWCFTRCEGLWESIDVEENQIPGLFGAARPRLPNARRNSGSQLKPTSDQLATLDLKAILLLIHTLTSCKVTPVQIEDCRNSSEATELLMDVAAKVGLVLPIASFQEYRIFVMLRLAAVVAVAKAVLIPSESDGWLATFLDSDHMKPSVQPVRTPTIVTLPASKGKGNDPHAIRSPVLSALDDRGGKLVVYSSMKALVETRLHRSNAVVKREKRMNNALATLDALAVAKHQDSLMDHRDLQRSLVKEAMTPQNDNVDDDDHGPVIWAHPPFLAAHLTPVLAAPLKHTLQSLRDVIRSPSDTMLTGRRGKRGAVESSPRASDASVAGLRTPSQAWSDAMREHINAVLTKHYKKLADIFTFYCIGQKMGKLDIANFLRDCKMWQDSADSSGFGRRKSTRLPGGGTDLLRILGITDQTQLDLNGFLSLVVAMAECQPGGRSWPADEDPDELVTNDVSEPLPLEQRGPVGQFVEENVLVNAMSCDMAPLVDALKSPDVELVIEAHKKFLARVFLYYADSAAGMGSNGRRRSTHYARRKSQHALASSSLSFTSFRKLMEDSRLTDESVSYLTIQQVYQKVSHGSAVHKQSSGLAYHEFVLLIFIIAGIKFATPFHPWSQKLARYIVLWMSRAPAHFQDAPAPKRRGSK
eukprot:TRINITY_DN14274_c0_g1_i1.p1 TRINITY_DN14274_c0_g1~~TRINITY_DN14274_c0_g1_i1.p1  ORF type:complete len:1080 (+),score=376.42 TRINITY_DN14274_c0_g1_i1:101-3340(+)